MPSLCIMYLCLIWAVVAQFWTQRPTDGLGGWRSVRSFSQWARASITRVCFKMSGSEFYTTQLMKQSKQNPISTLLGANRRLVSLGRISERVLHYDATFAVQLTHYHHHYIWHALFPSGCNTLHTSQRISAIHFYMLVFIIYVKEKRKSICLQWHVNS